MRGFTLLEMIVVLALFSVLLGVSTLAIHSLRPAAPSRASRARTQAVLTGLPTPDSGILFLPDGRAVGDGIDPLTGATHAR